MLISAAAASRRRFFSALMQRAAKAHRRFGGGSLSLLMALAGTPATGVRRGVQPGVDRYKHLSPAQKAKLQAVFEAQAAASSTGATAPTGAQRACRSACPCIGGGAR